MYILCGAFGYGELPFLYITGYIEQETYRGISYTRLSGVGLLLFPLSNADVPKWSRGLFAKQLG